MRLVDSPPKALPKLSGSAIALGWLLGFGPPACRCGDDATGLDDAPARCEQRGTLFVVDRVKSPRGTAQISAVHGGCSACPERLEPGALEGAVCKAHSVCAQSCCRCPNPKRWFVARACVDGRCPSQEAVCAVALEQFGSELCG